MSLFFILPLIPMFAKASEIHYNGDKVFIDDAYVYLSAQPHTIGSSGWVTLEFQSKVYTGDVDIALGFNQTFCKPTKIQLWKNYIHPNYKLINTELTSFISENGTTKYRQNTTYGWVNESYFDWIDWDLSVTPIEFDYQSFNKWYYSLNLPVVSGITYKARIYLNVPFSGLNVSTGKYYFAIKPSDETIQQAIDNDHFYCLDPWWNTAWQKRQLISINKDYITSLLINFPVGINCTSIKENCSSATGADVRFIGIDNTTEYYYELENWSSPHPVAWVNITRVFSTDNTLFYIYFKNPTATDNQNPTKVWDGYYSAVWHMNDSTILWDSTTNRYSSTAILGATPSTQVGRFGYGINFTTGGGGGYNLGNVLDVTTNSFSLEVLWNISSFRAQSDRICGKYDPGVAGYEFCGQSSVDREIFSYLLCPAGNIWIDYASNTGMDNGQWREFWYRRSSQTTVEQQVTPFPSWLLSGSNGAFTSATTAVNFCIGIWPAAIYNWNGMMDEMRFSSVARNDSWLNATYHNSNASDFFIWSSSEIKPWYNYSWNCRKPININYLKVPSILSNFPVLINLSTDANLASDALDNGSDILFVLSDNSTKLNHEIELFNGTTGQLSCWVNVTSLSNTSNTLIWMYYNNPSALNQQNKYGTWSGTYGGVWHMNATNASDSANNNNGTQTGNPGTAPGIVNTSVDFMGTPPTTNPDFINVGIGSTINLSNVDTCTLECWINFDVNSVDQVFMGQSAVSSSWNILLGTYDTEVVTNAIKFIHRDDDGTARDTLTSLVSITVGSWMYIAGTYSNGVPDNKSIYIDGVLKSSTATGINNLRPNAVITQIGYLGDYGACNGRIDEVRISKTAFNSSWINTTYNTIANPSTFFSIGDAECLGEVEVLWQWHSNDKVPLISFIPLIALPFILMIKRRKKNV
jgi:hypothetical protein